VAHEFKNPLAIIAASVEFLTSQAGGATPERIGMVAGHVQDAVGRLRRSLDALLTLLRLEATLKEEPREAVPYGELLEELLADYRRDPRWADCTLRAECAADVGAVWIVPHRWEEMLRNLLDNALQQPSLRREVILRAHRRDREIVTEVVDFGPGVSPGNRDKIFRRFFTQRPEGTPAGTGLGLSIVQAIVKAHGGQVTLASDPGPPATGATFVVTLPSAES
jgi:two-component system sensor histidine kinase ChvG